MRSGSKNTPGCLDEAKVLAWLDGALPTEQRVSVEAHLTSCRACEELATWAAADIANRSRAPGREGWPFVGQLEPGSRVGRYQILGAVGRGGMGEVYAAYHPDLDRRIALKVVHEAGVESAEKRGRLLREARAIARLSHANVVAVHDAGTVGDRVFIAMEFIDGETLEQWLKAEVRSWQQVVDVFIAAGRGLAAAHAAKIVHRDFKPQNVMIGRDGAVRVTDFGLARLLSDGAGPAAQTEAGGAVSSPATTITKTGALLGTPAYMVPEQFRGEADARADQFSFCVALYEALHGHRPDFAAVPTGDAIKNGSTRQRSVAPAWLLTLVLKGLATEPAQRHASMDALLSALVARRARVRKRFSAVAVAACALVAALGGLHLARRARVACTVPEDRVSSAWSSKPADPRREAVRRAFLATGRDQVETTWQRVSAALDEYVAQWRAMYVETCEATHVRG